MEGSRLLTKADMKERYVLVLSVVKLLCACGIEADVRRQVRFQGQKIDDAYKGEVKACTVPYVIDTSAGHRQRHDLAMFNDIADASARETVEACVRTIQDPCGRSIAAIAYSTADGPMPVQCTLSLSDGHEAFCTGYTKSWALVGALVQWEVEMKGWENLRRRLTGRVPAG